MCEHPIKFEDTRSELGLVDSKRLSMMSAPTQYPIEVSDQDLQFMHQSMSWIQSSYCLACVLAMNVCFACGCGWIIISISTMGVDLQVPHGWEAQLPSPPLGTSVQRRSCILVRPLLDVFTWYFGFQSMLPYDLCFHWNAWISCLDDVSLFGAFPYCDVQHMIR